jgi:hypothetical protein
LCRWRGWLKHGHLWDENTTVNSYKGSLRVAATADVIDAVFEVSDQTLRVRSGDQVLGTWALFDVTLENRPDGIHASLDGEQVIVSVPNPDAFVDAVAPGRRRPRGRHDRGRREKKGAQGRFRKRPVQPTLPPRDPVVAPLDELDEPPAVRSLPDATSVSNKERRGGQEILARLRSISEVFDADNWRSWLQDRLVRWTIASVGVMVLALMVLLAANTLGMILVLLGMVALIIAALAVSDDLSAYRVIPNALNETSLVIAGAAAMVIGALLVLIG